MKWRGLHPQNSHKVGDNNACISSQHETRRATAVFIRNTSTCTDSVIIVIRNTSTAAVFNRNTIATRLPMLLLLYLMLTLLLSALCSPACAATSRIRVTMVAHRYFYATASGEVSGTTSMILLHLYFKLLFLGFYYFFATSTSTLLLFFLRYYIYCCGDNGGALLSRWRPRWRRLGRPDNPWGGQSTISPSLAMSRPKEDHRLNTNVMTGLQILQRQRQGSKAGGSSEYQYVDCSSNQCPCQYQ